MNFSLSERGGYPAYGCRKLLFFAIKFSSKGLGVLSDFLSSLDGFPSVPVPADFIPKVSDLDQLLNNHPPSSASVVWLQRPSSIGDLINSPSAIDFTAIDICYVASLKEKNIISSFADSAVLFGRPSISNNPHLLSLPAIGYEVNSSLDSMVLTIYTI